MPEGKGRFPVIRSVVLPAVLLLVTGGAPVLAETYRWTDDAGTVHFSDSWGEIPSRFRGAAGVVGNSVSVLPEAPAREKPFFSGTSHLPSKLPAAAAPLPPQRRESSVSQPPAPADSRLKKVRKQKKSQDGSNVGPARRAQESAEQRIRSDRQKLDDSQLPARRAQDDAAEQIRKAREKTFAH